VETKTYPEFIEGSQAIQGGYLPRKSKQVLTRGKLSHPFQDTIIAAPAKATL